MKSVRSIVSICVTLLIGVFLGAHLSYLPTVKAQTFSPTYIHIQKVSAGLNAKNMPADERNIIGFACTATDCYIATQ